MGAWGHEVLMNDTALDAMIVLENSTNIQYDVEKILDDKHENVSVLLLAVEIVDISLNGLDTSILGELYRYDDWFKKITKMPMPDLRKKAISALEKVTATDYTWFDEVRENRKQLLQKIKNRLTKAVVTRNFLQLVDVNVDGCGTDIQVLVELIGKELTEDVIAAAKDAIKNIKHELEGQWSTDDCVDAALETLKAEGYECNVITPDQTIEF